MRSDQRGKGMIRSILITVFVVMVIGLIAFWLLSGGIDQAVEAGRVLTNPVTYIFDNGTSTGMTTRLPWQPAPVQGPDISGYVEQAAQLQYAGNQTDTQTSNAQQTQAMQAYGNPSPYAGEVTFGANNAAASSAAREYVELVAASDNASAINITGWSLQSAISGVRATLPGAVPVFVGGVVNSASAAYLAPGASAIVSAGNSPIGISFRENICTGYLGSLQSFTPGLGNSCPAPVDALPQTPGNLQTYGATCFEYLDSLDACATPGTYLPSSLSANCRSFIASEMTYNGCVENYRATGSFSLPVWRLYLGSSAALWGNSHDVIRLLDAQGRIVDALTY